MTSLQIVNNAINQRLESVPASWCDRNDQICGNAILSNIRLYLLGSLALTHYSQTRHYFDWC